MNERNVDRPPLTKFNPEEDRNGQDLGAADGTTPSRTVTRKPDDKVGKPGAAPAGGGRQTVEQAAITKIEEGGRSDLERGRSWDEANGGSSRTTPPVGGASSGHAEQKSTDDAKGKVAAGHYDVEKNRRKKPAE